METGKVWGWELAVDASDCEFDKITSYDNIYNFTKRLVHDIEMVPFGEPQIVNFGTGDKAGYTLTQLIETSNICAHFANDLNAVFLNVHSCKPYKNETVVDLVKAYFGAKKIRTSFTERIAN